MAFDTDAYISGLAATHRLQPDPADTDRADLADIKARMNAMHQWSTAVLAEHNRDVAQTLGRPPQPARQTTSTAPGPRRNRRRAPRR